MRACNMKYLHKTLCKKTSTRETLLGTRSKAHETKSTENAFLKYPFGHFGTLLFPFLIYSVCSCTTEYYCSQDKHYLFDTSQ